MATAKESAKAYQPKQFKNITELDAFPLSLEMHTETKKNSDGEEYTINYVGINGERYRVPNSVLESIKTILEEKPDCSVVKVTKKGDGLNTRYTVLPLE